MESQPKTNQDWLDLGRQYLLRHPMLTAPIVPERAEGIHMWDVEGRRYIDFQSGQLCLSLGHSHKEYVDALCTQARKIIQTGTSFVTPEEVLLAKKMAEIAPGPLRKSFFVSTGSESNEMAIRLVRKYTERFELIALMRGYHGQTAGSISISGRGGFMRDGFGPMLPGVTFIPTPFDYRCPFCRREGSCNMMCVDYAEEIIDTATSGKPAAIFLEPLLSSAGQIVPPVEWMQAIRRICDDRGMLMVVDEALTGFGRTGKWFAFEHFEIVPDVVTFSKGLGGGVPLGAVMTTVEIADKAVEKGFAHFSSHAGDPLLCATGLANIQIIEKNNYVENARRMGNYMRDRLDRMVQDYEIAGEARGLGLCQGLDLVTEKTTRTPNFKAASEVTTYCHEHGLWLPLMHPSDDRLEQRYMEMFGAHVLRFMPPINITEEQVDEALEIIEAGIRAAQEKANW